ncbi:hypothetical protein Y032_0125g1271 [Ancylostoma ceylanicum]|uniref:Uncharacterized protein n=1 Tax=Ancylostoma ceylanicum TaxID=53326 RepID=A0A016T823_9BILA|nr:hypothetical protein Y032_0125g1271 [Ancylostoma ceylanicum]
MESKQYIEIVHFSHFTTVLMERSGPSCICDDFTIFSIFVTAQRGSISSSSPLALEIPLCRRRDILKNRIAHRINYWFSGGPFLF